MSQKLQKDLKKMKKGRKSKDVKQQATMAEESKLAENDHSGTYIFDGKKITEEEFKAFLEMTVNAQNRDTLNVFKSFIYLGKCKTGEFNAPKQIVDGTDKVQTKTKKQIRRWNCY